MRIFCWQMILMKYHALFVIFEEIKQENLKFKIMTASDDKFCDIFPNFEKNKV